MLGAPLEEWRMFLHPAQRKAVEQVYRGPARVLGDAGAGKAVVAMHRARHLARGLSGEDRVLLTPLADDSQIPRCRHIVVDEAQDFAPITLRLVRELAGPERRDDLFIVGDARQRIFSKRATLHVAMTRSRRATYIKFSGPPSPFLTDMRQHEPEGI